ncbi:MAG TPA: hypothetical protein VFN74_10285, partial [Chloroflexota bacterium]|nr:hypothetical protein [Chloroflexota bacterium]
PLGFSDGSAEARAIGSTLVSNNLGDGRGLSLGSFSGVGSATAKTGRARDMVLDARPEDEHGEARAENPENIAHIDGQIVDRDYKLVAQSETVVVFYPTTTLSAGVICEMKEAIHRGKRVYALWMPANPPSPFFTRYCTKWFREEDALFGYLDRAGITVSSTAPATAAKEPIVASGGSRPGRR